MRKSVIALSLILALGLTACDKPKTPSASSTTPRETTPVATTPMSSTIAETPAQTADKLANVKIGNSIRLDSAYKIDYAQIRKDGQEFSAVVAYKVSDKNKETEYVLDEFDLFVKHEVDLLLKLAEENNAIINHAIFIVHNSEEEPILSWYTGELVSGSFEMGDLYDLRNGGRIEYKDISIDEIGEILYGQSSGDDEASNTETVVESNEQ